MVAGIKDLNVVTTFTPLSHGRLRCNQTKEVVKKGRTDAYRTARMSQNKPPPAKASKKAIRYY